MIRLLLLSNSTCHGQGYLDHAMPAIREFLGPVRKFLFVPFALSDQEGYAAKVRLRFEGEGIAVSRLTADRAGQMALASAEAVFVGGGNTFRLLDRLQHTGLLQPLRERALGGMPYLGASAGSNVAGATIKTTNDMPIVEPASFEALGLLPFQINPHYLDPVPGSSHMGETREERLREYLEENEPPVVALREGAWLHREGASLRLEGSVGARIFRRETPPEEVSPGTALDALLA
jgi:dipeptidase E